MIYEELSWANRSKVQLTIECDLFVAQQVNETSEQFLLLVVLCLAILQRGHDVSARL